MTRPPQALTPEQLADQVLEHDTGYLNPLERDRIRARIVTAIERRTEQLARDRMRLVLDLAEERAAVDILRRILDAAIEQRDVARARRGR